MDIGGLEDAITGSRLLTAEDVAEVTAHIERLEVENTKLRKCCVYYDREKNECGYYDPISHRLEAENKKLRTLVGHLMYVKPRDVTSVLVNGEVFKFDELLAEVGMRWEDGSEA